MYAYHGPCRFISTVFNDNLADSMSAGSGDGGALYAGLYSRVDLLNCLMYVNGAVQGGGVFFTGNSQTRIVNCTLAYNTAAAGPSLYIDGGSCTVLNTIMWNAVTDPVTPAMAAVTGTLADITYSCAMSPAVFPGEGNSNSDPLFSDAANDNYHMAASRRIGDTTYYTPCIDLGDPDTFDDDRYPQMKDILEYGFTQEEIYDDLILSRIDMGYHYRLIP